MRDVVMVVRETPSLADSVEELLSSDGYRVRRVSTAREGYRYLRSTRGRDVRATVVVCNEAVCSGLDTIAAAEAHTPVIVLGWRGAPFLPRAGSKLLLLRLPISAGVLLRNLRSLLDGSDTARPAAAG